MHHSYGYLFKLIGWFLLKLLAVSGRKGKGNEIKLPSRFTLFAEPF